MEKHRKIKMLFIIVSSAIVMAGVGTYMFLKQPSFGKLPEGKRLERIERSPNYRKGVFWNQIATPMMTGEKNRWQVMWDFIFGDRKNLCPQDSIPVIHTDLKRLPKEQNLMVWFGHSSYMIQIDGKRILVDPVFCKASPVSFINKPFSGTDIYRPEDMPEIDLLIITHDHWDHLDYETVTALQEKVAKVVCPLGIGEDFEYWGYDSDKLIELDWSEHTILDNIDVHCLPARHFSGRGLASNKTLWASYMIESPSTTIFIGGDGGYGPHFKEIGESFTNIDWAILENGQYNNDWKYIHTMPSQLEQVAKDLKAENVVTVHHSKYALSNHPWNEPIKTAEALKGKGLTNVAIPKIGEVLQLKGSTQNKQEQNDSINNAETKEVPQTKK